MSEEQSDVRRLLSSSGVYALAGSAQQALSFLLLPIYTRFIEPAEFGVLEIMTAFSALLFGVLALGLPSAVVKAYHRDCETEDQRARVLATGLSMVTPALLVGSGLTLLAARPVSVLLLGDESGTEYVRIVAASGLCSSVSALVLSALRAEERAVAYSVVSLFQVATALSLNLVLVVVFEMGVRGVLIGNLVSHIATVPVGLLAARKRSVWRFERSLARPMLRFGILLIPVTLTGWIVNMSDRYVLRLFSELADVAVYGVGYKFGMIIEILVVWPFQLAWPAFAFSISHREGHQRTYARTLTYLTLVLAFMVLALTFTTRVALFWVVGEGYWLAYRVVPLVATAYALSGLTYCVSPGIHIANQTRWITIIAIAGAALNLPLNFALIPTWGPMGAAAATTLSFLLVNIATIAVARRWYPVEYEWVRLAKIVLAAGAILWIGVQVSPEATVFSVLWHASMVVLLPLVLLGIGFLDADDRAALRAILERLPGRPFGRTS